MSKSRYKAISSDYFKYSLIVINGLLLLVVGIIGVNFVKAQGSNATQIHSCVSNSNGNVRIIGANDTCKNTETPTNWPGVSSVSELEVVSVNSETYPSGIRATADVTASCPSGKIALSGGAKIEDATTGDIRFDTVALSSNSPVGSPPNGWRASAFTVLQTSAISNSYTWRLTVNVVCAKISS